MGNWRLYYNVSSRLYTCYDIKLFRMSDNVKALSEIDLSLVLLRQAIEKEYRTYERSLHQAIRAVDRCGFQDGCAVAASGGTSG